MNEQHKRWDAFADVLPQFRKEADYSPLWYSFIRDFKIKSGGFKAMDKCIQKNCRGYSFRNSPLFFPRLRDTAELLYGFTVLKMDAIWRWFLSAAKGKKLGRMFDWRTYKLYAFLQKNDIRIDEFLLPVKEVRQIRMNYNSLKTVYFINKVFSNCLFDRNAVNSFIEVGAGAANFLIIAASRFSNLNYYVVDLPEMLLVSSYETLKYVPDAHIIMPNDIEKGALERQLPGKKNFIFLTPSQFKRIPDRSTDLAVNIESFAEMPQKIAEDYVHAFYRVLKTGGYMFTANRESRIISEDGSFTCYWNLPYSDNDEMLLWEYCPMRQFLMNGMSPNINRLARITL
jgi:hypothetical protein